MRAPSGGNWGNWESKDEWYAPRPPGPKVVSPIEVWEKATGEKWENSKEYKEVHKKYGIPPSKPVSGALRAGTRAFEREQERLHSEAQGGMTREQIAAENEGYYTKLATAYPLKSGPVWEGLETDSDYTSSEYTSDSESDSEERVLLYATWQPDTMARPHFYAVNVDEGLFKQTPGKYDLEAQARWPAFFKFQESRIKSKASLLT